MGYYAKAKGFVDFKTVLDDGTTQKVKQELESSFGMVDIGQNTPTLFKDKTEPFTSVALWNDGKYYDYEVSEALDEISKVAEIAEGEIDYRGEDDTYWRFVWQDGEWREETGEVTYESDTDIPTDKVRAAERILQDNGVESDETAIVLQAIGYVLLDKELYPKEASTAAQAVH